MESIRSANFIDERPKIELLKKIPWEARRSLKNILGPLLEIDELRAMLKWALSNRFDPITAENHASDNKIYSATIALAISCGLQLSGDWHDDSPSSQRLAKLVADYALVPHFATLLPLTTGDVRNFFWRQPLEYADSCHWPIHDSLIASAAAVSKTLPSDVRGRLRSYAKTGAKRRVWGADRDALRGLQIVSEAIIETLINSGRPVGPTDFANNFQTIFASWFHDNYAIAQSTVDVQTLKKTQILFEACADGFLLGLLIPSKSERGHALRAGARRMPLAFLFLIMLMERIINFGKNSSITDSPDAARVSEEAFQEKERRKSPGRVNVHQAANEVAKKYQRRLYSKLSLWRSAQLEKA